MISFLFCFYDGEAIYEFFYVMKGSSHLVSAIQIVLQFHESLSVEVSYELVRLLLVGLDISIEMGNLLLQFDVTGKLLQNVRLSEGEAGTEGGVEGLEEVQPVNPRGESLHLVGEFHLVLRTGDPPLLSISKISFV